MTNPRDPSLHGLSDCGCGAGIEPSTPVAGDNRPGLPVIAFRSGTHAQFKASLLAGLTTLERPELAGLTTRAADDFTIALLDGFSAMADVVTFYSERIANEAFLRTATERRSVLELARAIGYELKPGVAATAWLAFNVEEAPGAPGYASVRVGTKVQSVPGPGEKPQTYETIEALDARKEWNELRALASELEVPWFGMRKLHLAGVATNLTPGDALLIIGAERQNASGSERWDFRRVQALEAVPDPDPTKAYTVVTLDRPLGSVLPRVEPAQADAKVFALRTRASLFGHQAPDWRAMPESIQAAFAGPAAGNRGALTEWPGFTLSEVTGFALDGPGLGLFGAYYNTSDFQQRRFTRTDPQIHFNWGASSPDPRVDSDTFSIRWTGWIQPPVTADYTFHTVSDDGVRLRVNHQLIIDQWNLHPATEHTSAPVRLEAGRKYPIRLDYFENGGAAVIELHWSRPGQARELVPTSQLFPAPEELLDRELPDGARFLHLDAVYKDLVPGGWAVLSTPEYQEVYAILEAVEDSCAAFTLSAKCTRLMVLGEHLFQQFNDRLRDVTVFAQSEWLPWAETPIRRPVQGARLELDRALPALTPRRRLIVQGRQPRARVAVDSLVAALPDSTTRPLPRDQEVVVVHGPEDWSQPLQPQRWEIELADGAAAAVTAPPPAFVLLPAKPDDPLRIEQATLKQATTPDNGRTTLELTAALRYAYDPATLRVAANVALASHGETVEEVLGHGDAAQAHQTFALRQEPLTYTPAATPSGGESSLEIWVNDVQWQEAPSLFAREPRERVFVARQQDERPSTVTFGDGRFGARLPTGAENVRAVYRKGTGLEGLVKAGQLSLLLTRPLGLKGVTNPQASAGAEDPETLAGARVNAPLQVLTLGRAVSLQDYADFARAFSGIAKSHATWVWTPQGRGVFVTVLAPEGRTLPPDSETLRDLRKALVEFGNPQILVRVEVGTLSRFAVAGTVLVARDHLLDRVKAELEAALTFRFDFDASEFGLTVARSEILRIIQAVPGVVAVRLTAPSTAALQPAVPAAGAALTAAQPASLLVLNALSLPNLETQFA